METKTSLTLLSDSDIKAVGEYYHEYGYVIVQRLIPNELIDNFITKYNNFKAKKNYVIRAQDTNRPELLQINNEGFIEHSIWCPHELPYTDGFAKCIEEIILHPQVSKILSAISGEEKHTLWQSMFFDKSTGTVEHQDHYYLDTEPAGGLIGIWIAIEDINPEAGSFYVCPKTHTNVIADRTHDHNDEYVNAIKKYILENNIKKLPCPIKKGDAIFWHGMTIHGSFENRDKKFSRKSITAHYIPNSYKKIGAKTTIGHIAIKPPTMPSSNPNIDVWQSSDIKRKVTYLRKSIRYRLNKIFRKSVEMEMRSKDGKYLGNS